MRRLVLALRLALASLAFAVYVWFAAVLNLGRVKRRKAARRGARSRAQAPAEPRPEAPERPAEAKEAASSR